MFVGALVTAAALVNPHIEPATEYVSALGGPEARRPWLFNVALIVAGLAAAGLGVGFGLAVRALGGEAHWGWGAAGLFLIGGAGLVVGGGYPWPDPRHLAIQAGLGVQLAPLLLAIALRGVRGTARLRVFLLGAFGLLMALAVVNSGWMFAQLWGRQPIEQLVHSGNVGWWERGYMLVFVVWTAVAAVWLERLLARSEPEPQLPS